MSMPILSVYHALFKSLPGVYLLLDENFTVVDTSDSYKNLASLLNPNVVGKSILEVYQDNIHVDDFHDLKQILSKSNAYELKIRVNALNHSQMYRKERIFNVIQVPVMRYFIHSINDVTDYYVIQKIKDQQDKLTEGLLTQAGEMEGEIYQYIKKLEEKNKELIHINENLSKLETAKSRLATIVEFTEDGIIAVSLDGKIEIWNNGSEKLYGYDANEAIGKPVEMIFPENKMNEYYEAYDKIIRGKAIHYFDTKRKHKKGHNVHVSVTISPIKNDKNEVVGACSIARDISEYKILRQLKVKNKELMQVSNLKNYFIANVSHEFRTPLHGILGFSKLLLMNCSEAQKEYIDHIINSGNHLNSLINDVLDLTKIESGKLEVNLSEIHLLPLVDETKNLFKNALLKKNIEFTSHIDETLVFIFSDLKKIKQILYNYISNAIKFTPEDGKISLDIRREVDDKIRLTVSDNGIGIQNDDLSKLFVEFQQLDASTTKNYQGSGLGLAIVRRIATLLGGEAGVESKKNVGSSFYVILPCRLHPSDFVNGEGKV